MSNQNKECQQNEFSLQFVEVLLYILSVVIIHPVPVFLLKYFISSQYSQHLVDRMRTIPELSH